MKASSRQAWIGLIFQVHGCSQTGMERWQIEKTDPDASPGHERYIVSEALKNIVAGRRALSP
jgi:hypothetical protein